MISISLPSAGFARRALRPQPYLSYHLSPFSGRSPSRLSTTSSPFRAAVVPPPALAPQTLTEKIVQRYAVDLPHGKLVRSGDYVSISPAYCMTHENTAPVATKFESMGATRVHTPEQIVTTLDHDIQNTSPSNLQKYRRCREFAAKHGIVHYGAGRGIGHQIMVEEGYVWPGTMVVASDSHAVHYGALGCLGTPIVRTDAASIFATSRTWWQVPPVVQVTLLGKLPPNVTGKDVIVALCSHFTDDVLNHAVEFVGSEETMASLPIDYRATIANMSCEWGALSGLFPIDHTLEDWLRSKATEAAELEGDKTRRIRINDERINQLFANPLVADPGAVFAKQLYISLSSLSPYVSGPNSVKVARPLHELAPQKIKVDRAYVVSCTNSRASDIAEAAKVFKEAAQAHPETKPRVADGVQLYICAASAAEQAAAEAAGDWQVLLEAGGQALPSGCGPCIGLGRGLLESGEVGISASNRNWSGRMGSTAADAYLASPGVVAASALNGIISGSGVAPAGWSGVVRGYGTGPGQATGDTLGSAVQQPDPLHTIVGSAAKATSQAASYTEILPGFPSQITGEILFCDADHLNTDAIYPGRLTYQDAVSRDEMARACMANYDVEFATVARPGDVLVAGANFGCGSSREQAATALLARQIALVVASSFGGVFARNSINNALMTLELPRLVERLRRRFPSSSSTGARRRLTRRTGWTLTWDIGRSVVEVVEAEGGDTWSEKVGDLPSGLQAIIAAGGLEAWCKAEISKSRS